ncbi:LOW QUALITY PROTEIN: interferon epsilon [Erethizon dorsatum]
MIHKQYLEILLVLLASSTIFSLEPKLALFQQRMKEGLQLLNNLQTSSVQQRLPHRKNFLIPQKSVGSQPYQKDHALAILYEMLQLFKVNISLNGKNNHIEKFLIELRQLEYLEALIGLEAEQENGALGSENLRLQVRAYFRMRKYLENGYSRCAQTTVQVEINQCLLFLFRLTGKLSK